MNLKDLLPEYYNNVYEIEELINSEQKTFNNLDDTLNRSLLNQFVMFADKDGLEILESQFNIVASSGESEEDRRYNLLTKLLPPKPITIKYFKELIASLNIPAETKVDAIKMSFIAVLNSDNINDSQVDKLNELMATYLPANLIGKIIKLKYINTDMNRYIGTANQLKMKSASVCKQSL